MRLAALTLLAFALGGCSDPPPVPYEIIVQARDDQGAPLPGVKVRIGEDSHTTNEEGSALAEVFGSDGMPVEFEPTCPPGFRLLDAPRRIALRRIRLINSEAFAAIRVDLSCTPLMRQAVILLHLGVHGASLPVSVNNLPAGTTDESGTLHILLEDIASRRFNVEIDTSEKPDIRPFSPSRTFTMPDRNELFTYELLMSTEEKKPKPKRRRRRRRKPRSSGPVRL